MMQPRLSPVLMDVAGTRALRKLMVGMVRPDVIESFKAYSFDGCRVIVAREPIGTALGLEWHLSISREDRYPSWDEIAHARYALLPDSITFGMILPPRGEYVNAHDYTFHLHELPPR